ncbi:MAG: hypothetical protein WEB53_11765, partial [Akkermansiaceae bacterium]
PTIAVKRPRAKDFTNSGSHSVVRIKKTMDRQIAIEDHDGRHPLPQKTTDCRFSGSDPTCQYHHSHELKTQDIVLRNQAKKPPTRTEIRFSSRPVKETGEGLHLRPRLMNFA